MSDPSLNDIIRYQRFGAIAAYEHCAMIRLHYHVADALDECLKKLEGEGDHIVRKGRLNSVPMMVATKIHRIGGGDAPDGVCASTEASSSGEEEDDDAHTSGFDETEAYVSGRARTSSG